MIRRRALVVRTISYGLNVISNVALVVISSRMLTPSQVGAFAWGGMLVQPLSDILVAGLAWGVLQRTRNDSREISHLHVVSLAVAAALAGAYTLVIAIIRPEFLPMAIWFLIAILLAPSEGVASGILSHGHKFEHLAIIASLGVVTNFVVTVSCLKFGLGPYSLAIGFVSAAAIRTISFSIYATPGFHLPSKDELSAVWPYLRFAFATGLSKTLGNLAKIAPGWIVGPIMGTEALGLLTRAQRLGMLPADVFTSLIGGMLGPVFSKARSQTDGLRIAYGNAVHATVLLTLPASSVAIALMPDIVRLLLGSEWIQISDLLRVFLLGSVFHNLLKISDDAVRATGEVRFQIRGYILYIITIVAVSLVIAFLRMPLVLIAVAILIASALRAARFVSRALLAIAGKESSSLRLSGIVAEVRKYPVCILTLLFALSTFLIETRWLALAATLLGFASIPRAWRAFRALLQTQN